MSVEATARASARTPKRMRGAALACCLGSVLLALGAEGCGSGKEGAATAPNGQRAGSTSDVRPVPDNSTYTGSAGRTQETPATDASAADQSRAEPPADQSRSSTADSTSAVTASPDEPAAQGSSTGPAQNSPPNAQNPPPKK